MIKITIGKNEVRRTILKFEISNRAVVIFPILGYFPLYFAWVILWPITSMRPGWKIGFVSKFRKKWKFWNILESNSGVRFWPFRVRKNNKKVKKIFHFWDKQGFMSKKNFSSAFWLLFSSEINRDFQTYFLCFLNIFT